MFKLLSFCQETALRAMHDGLELHHGLLRSISPRLEVKDRMNALQYDVRDLKIEIFRVRNLLNPASEIKLYTFVFTF